MYGINGVYNRQHYRLGFRFPELCTVYDEVIFTKNNYNNIPQGMRKYKNWVCFKKVKKKDKSGKERITKVPFMPNGAYAKSNRPETWSDFEAVTVAKGFDGIGFVFTNTPYVGIDIDHCKNADGGLSPIAAELVDLFKSYTEYSPSGEGLHIIVEGSLKEMGVNGRKNDKLGLEMYDSMRYFTMTGNIYPQGKREIYRAQNEIEIVYNKYLKADNKKASSAAVSKTSSWGQSILSDEELLKYAAAGKNGAAFNDLYYGRIDKYNNDHSAADLAFCNMLAFWCRCDYEQMDRIFRTSNLMRNKWNEIHGVSTYGNMTLTKAIDDCKEIFEPTNKTAAEDFKGLEGKHAVNTYPFLDNKLKPIKKHWENTEWLCRQQGIDFKLNELTKRVETSKEDLNKLSFDAMVTEVLGICHSNDFTIMRSDLIDHIGRIAEKNKYNPVRDYLNECHAKWDKKSRINDLFDCFVLNEEVEQSREFCFLLFKKWLVTCVVMAFNEGKESAQGALILAGPQGIGKTRFLYCIVPDSSWVKDGVSIDFKNKDDVIRAVSYWIVELGEIGATMKREKLDKLKAFITDKTDVFRAPYARAMETHPRNTVFLGTVNKDEFLKDDTGERRNWVISVSGIKQNPHLDINQLWGEVMELAFVQKFPHWLSQEEIDTLNKQNERYKVLNGIEQLLLDEFEWDCEKKDWFYINATDLCEMLSLDKRQAANMGKALKRLSALGIVCPTNHKFKRYRCPKFKNSCYNQQISLNTKRYKDGFRVVEY